jgi:ketoreductase
MKNEKTVFITGAGSGIGRAIALRLAENGRHLVLGGRTMGKLDRVAAEVTRQGAQCGLVPLDVRDPEAVVEAVKRVRDEHGDIGTLVNCAGISGGGPTQDMNEDLWRDLIDTNLNGVFYTTKAVLKHGGIGDGGSIINIASTGGKQGVVYGAGYSASKHGVVGFTKALGLELASKGITVNAVCPGFVETDMAQKTRDAYAKIWGVSSAEAKDRIEKRVPIGRYVQPEEVAEMVAYLLGPSARGVTAQALNVCGGLGNY